MGKKILLNVRAEPTYFTLIGISCHLKDYRLSYLLNQKLDYSFTKLEDLQDFSFYFYRDEDRFNTYSLVANRNQEAVLVPQLKQTDFLLLVEGEFKKAQKDPVLNAIRTIPSVLTAFEIKLPELKNFENLLTDIEMHVMNIFKVVRNKYQPNLKI